MRIILSIVITFFLYNSSFAQVYESKAIIEKGRNILYNAVGEHLITYYKFDTESYYEYRTKSGKTKWKALIKKDKTKGTFVSVNVRFILQHPDFPFEWVNKITHIRLDSSLNLISEPNIDFIPEFLRKNVPSNWLTETKLDKIIKKRNLKRTKYPITKRLEFDTKTRTYKWTIFNTLYEEEYYSDVEYLEIDPISGKILIHKEIKLYTTI